MILDCNNDTISDNLDTQGTSPLRGQYSIHPISPSKSSVNETIYLVYNGIKTSFVRQINVISHNILPDDRWSVAEYTSIKDSNIVTSTTGMSNKSTNMLPFSSFCCWLKNNKSLETKDFKSIYYPYYKWSGSVVCKTRGSVCPHPGKGDVSTSHPFQTANPRSRGECISTIPMWVIVPREIQTLVLTTMVLLLWWW